LKEPVGPSASAGDQETRQRLLEVASRLFAERGFHHVTVRDICSEAEANVAAINYHFRDKSALYKEVLQPMMDFMNETYRLAHKADPSATPEERLRHYVRVVLHRVLGEGATCRHGRLMAREMVDPTPGLDLIIEQVIRPNSRRLHALVSELMGIPLTDPRIGLCVGSIQTQIFGHINNPIIDRLVPNLKYTSNIVDSLADHIADFSLGGIVAVAEHKAGVRT
jgi:AcrR family transcriptional regulator